MKANFLTHKQIIAIIIAFIILLFFMAVILLGIDIKAEHRTIVSLLGALAGGLSAYLFTGDMNIKGNFLGIPIEATSAFAFAVLMFMGFYYAPSDKPHHLSEVIRGLPITQEIVPESTSRGQVQINIKDIDNYPHIERKQYKVSLFASPKDNFQKWDFQSDSYLEENLSLPFVVNDKLEIKCFLFKSIISDVDDANFDKYPTRYDNKTFTRALNRRDSCFCMQTKNKC
jgi:hypothetical protein